VISCGKESCEHVLQANARCRLYGAQAVAQARFSEVSEVVKREVLELFEISTVQ